MANLSSVVQVIKSLDGLLIATPFPPARGGIQNYLLGLYSNLPEHRFCVLSPRQPGCRDFDAVHSRLAIRRPRRMPRVRGARSVGLFIEAMRVVACDRVRHIHCGVVLPDGRVGYLLRRITGRPYLVYAYGMELYGSPAYESLITSILRGAGTVVAISRFTRSRLLDLGVDAARIELIPPGVDADFYVAGERDNDIRSKLGLQGKKVILSVGRQVERKGSDTVIRSLPEVLKIVPNAHYVIAGDGDYLSRLRDLTRELSLERFVTFALSPPDFEMPGLYAMCDVFAMVSRTLPGNDCEGFGIVFLEAGACGRPVIGGDSGGIPDAVVDGETGFLVDSADVGAVGRAIVRLLADDGLARRMGEAGRRRVLRGFTIQSQAAHLSRVIRGQS